MLFMLVRLSKPGLPKLTQSLITALAFGVDHRQILVSLLYKTWKYAVQGALSGDIFPLSGQHTVPGSIHHGGSLWDTDQR